jgi:hypothetical protein
MLDHSLSRVNLEPGVLAGTKFRYLPWSIFLIFAELSCLQVDETRRGTQTVYTKLFYGMNVT